MSKVILVGASGAGASMAAKLIVNSGHKVIVVEDLVRIGKHLDKILAKINPPLAFEHEGVHPSTIRSRGKGKRKKSWERPSFY